MATIEAQHFTTALKMVLDETFDHVQGLYLDPQTSLFETLNTISAAEASIPVGGRCATLAAQVKHTAFFLDFIDGSVRDPSYPPPDWGEIWRTVGSVTPTEWEDLQIELRAGYDRILMLIDETPEWPNERFVAGAISIIAHTAYHLGEIRQALCTIRQ